MENTVELRFKNLQLRSTDSNQLVVRGYVNKTNQLSEVMGTAKKFVEKIERGAFTKALQVKKQDVDFLAEHDQERILASTSNNSLELKEDEVGLFMEARIAPTSWGRDYYELITAGLFKNMSFGFRVLKDEWKYLGKQLHERTIKELELFEVSVVKNPAYSQSNISARQFTLIEEVEVPSIEQTEKTKGETRKMRKIETRKNELEEILKGESRSLQKTADGHTLVPQSVHQDIVHLMEEKSPIFALAKRYDSVSGNLKIAREDDSIEAGFVGEGDDIIESSFGFEYAELKQKRVGAAVTLTNQLINDSGINIEDYVKSLLARRVVKVVERSMLVGQEPEELNGIVHDENVKAISMDGVVTVDTLVDLYTSIHPEYLDDAAFIMEKGFFDQIAKLKDSNGHFYMQNGMVNGQLIRTLFGAPIHVTDSLPTTTPVIFGNYQEGVSMMIKQQSGLQEIVDSKQALRGSKLLVFDMYMDSIVTNPQALVKLQQV